MAKGAEVGELRPRWPKVACQVPGCKFVFAEKDGEVGENFAEV